MSAEIALAGAVPAVPGVAGLVGLLLPPPARRAAAVLGVTAAVAALAAAAALLVEQSGPAQGLAFHRPEQYDSQPVEAATRLADFGSLQVTLDLRVNAVAAAVALMVCAVALAVQVYSIAYLREDRRYGPYAAQVSLFTAAMLLVVVSGDLVLLLVGWEVMGLCSYLLIGHDRSLPEAPAAAVKAFLVTRVGDVGFLLGIVVLGLAAGSFRIVDVLAAASGGRVSPGSAAAGCLLLLAGVAGKSAQFPLQSWLPDAMAGPTPISALIHAATMVAAGVYVVIRLFAVFAGAPAALPVLGVMAAVTMLLGAWSALAQDDLKRMLAWSTVSQLAYMTGALAVGSTSAALRHLLAHAAFKALLFLAAGAVIHTLLTNSMSAMGGLRRSMPVTFWAMTVGLFALAGVPPFAGFWTKEGVLGAARADDSWVGWLVLIAGLVTTALTGAYATKLWLRTFFGEYRGEPRPGPPSAGPGLGEGLAVESWPAEAPPGQPHDPPGLMRWPVLVLAVAAAFGGVVVSWPRPAAELDLPLSALALVLTAAGASVVWWRWRRAPSVDPVVVPDAGAWLDAVQGALVVRPVLVLARAVRAFDVRGVGGLARGTGRGAVALGRALARTNAAGLAGYVTTALGGGVLLALVTVVVGR